MAQGNPNPVITPEFAASRFKRLDDSGEALSEKLTTVRLTQRVDAALRTLPNKSVWLRRVIAEAAERELMGDN